jgi:hypothetical protein
MVFKINRMYLNPAIKGVIPAYCIGQSSHTQTLLKKVVSNPSTRVTKGAGYYMERLSH